MVKTLSSDFEAMLGSDLGAAEDVLKLSAFYHAHPGEPTPWQEPFAVPAYLNYFLPLNYVRLKAAFQELRRFLATEKIGEIWDFGSGPGTTQWVLEDEEWLAPCPLHCVEISAQATRLHEQLLARRKNRRFQPRFATRPSRPGPHALAVFSYSFLELRPPIERLAEFEHVLIVEPATRDEGRALMESRKPLIEEGFHILAPCTHQKACPLLTHSSRDWCHMRVGFEAPEWFQRQEERLPMKNRTLTYSYLLLSRSAGATAAVHDQARVIGDTLEERGKTRQMVCRGENREFVSWLHRHGEPPRIPHGALLSGLESCQIKGAELRVTETSNLRWEE